MPAQGSTISKLLPLLHCEDAQQPLFATPFSTHVNTTKFLSCNNGSFIASMETGTGRMAWLIQGTLILYNSCSVSLYVTHLLKWWERQIQDILWVNISPLARAFCYLILSHCTQQKGKGSSPFHGSIILILLSLCSRTTCTYPEPLFPQQ